ncbi:hypothetical protein AB6A40_003151 [Gnathostoma spinigerum]|uniref:Transcription and mRNA export factor ENY2 n=1 Tax=Gnathostoma spinigerum TaxID=75299 RepID=A0ABD6EID8_9BILA
MPLDPANISKASLERAFVESGERDRVKELLSQRLRESGWVEQIENMCRTTIQEKGIDNVTLEDVINEVKAPARRAVPDEVKRELMQTIRSFLQKQTESENPEPLPSASPASVVTESEVAKIPHRRKGERRKASADRLSEKS